MKRSTVVILKTAVWIACLWPIGLLVRGAIVPGGLGPDPTAHIALTTGYTTLMLLTVTLAITPVRKFVPQLNWAIRFRRLLGLFAFFYGTVHMLTWVALYNYFSLHAMVHDIAKRRFITMGVAAYLLLLPLAVTSTNWAIRKMGGKRWNRLHKLVYVAAICGIIHYWWQVKTGVLLPLPFSIAIGILLGLRPVIAWRQRRKSRPTVAA
jgi:sulfoxide reductase heme-binding subunit YedZ